MIPRGMSFSASYQEALNSTKQKCSSNSYYEACFPFLASEAKKKTKKKKRPLSCIVLKPSNVISNSYFALIRGISESSVYFRMKE